MKIHYDLYCHLIIKTDIILKLVNHVIGNDILERGYFKFYAFCYDGPFEFSDKLKKYTGSYKSTNREKELIPIKKFVLNNKTRRLLDAFLYSNIPAREIITTPSSQDLCDLESESISNDECGDHEEYELSDEALLNIKMLKEIKHINNYNFYIEKDTVRLRSKVGHSYGDYITNRTGFDICIYCGHHMRISRLCH